MCVVGVCWSCCWCLILEMAELIYGEQHGPGQQLDHSHQIVKCELTSPEPVTSNNAAVLAVTTWLRHMQGKMLGTPLHK